MNLRQIFDWDIFWEKGVNVSVNVVLGEPSTANRTITLQVDEPVLARYPHKAKDAIKNVEVCLKGEKSFKNYTIYRVIKAIVPL